MSEIQESASLPESGPATDLADLPPVQPPSAGFIVQLFLIPAIIVAAVIGIWVLFGRMAGAEQDWRQLVQDVGSENEHRRWRAASGLAHLLNADRQRRETEKTKTTDDPTTAPAVAQEPPLATNPAVAGELVKLFNSQLDSRSSSDDDVTHQVFLAKTLGALDLPDVVLPALQRAITTDYDERVRASALSSIALVVSRAITREEEIDSDDLVRTLIDSSGDESVLVRQFSAFTLGLIPTEPAIEHLTGMLADADEKTRVNAAIGLARNGKVDGVEIFSDVLLASAKKLDKAALRKLNDAKRVLAMNRYQIEQPLMLNNTLRALNDLAPKLTTQQKATLSKRLEPLAAEYPHPELKKDAQQLLKKLK